MIEMFIKRSELILIEDIRQSFQSYFKTSASITFGYEQLQQKEQQKQELESLNVAEEGGVGDTCLYEISIPISKISLKCTLNQSHAHHFIHLQIFEKIMIAVQSSHHQKIKTWLSRFTNYSYFLHNTELVMMDFDKRGKLIFISQTLNLSTIENLKIKISEACESIDPKFYFAFQEIFKGNSQILEAIKSILSNPRQFSLRLESECEQHAEIIVNPQRHCDGFPRGFKLFLKQSNALAPTRIPLSSPAIIANAGQRVFFQENRLPQVSKIKRAMETLSFITRTSKTAISKELVLKDPNVKNSWVREYLPDRDLMKIQEDESQTEDSAMTPRSSQIRLFNPSTTFHNITDDLLVSQTTSKPQASDFVPKEEEDAQLDSFRFDILKCDPKEKVRIIWSIFQRRGYFSKYQIPISQFCEFINDVRYKYNKRSNPFHNFDHGITVMHGCYMISCNTSASKYLKDLHEFALVFSGLCHDVSHTARTNVFEVNSMSKLAIRYHDKSVLEQHHIAVTFKILRKKETNIFQLLPPDQVQAFRKLVISNVMATDIKQHFDLLKEFELRFVTRMTQSQTELPSVESGETPFTEADTLLLSKMIIHAADFHGNAQEFDLSKRWSLLVNQEFQSQFKEEGEKNIPQTMYLKDLDKRDTLARSEIGFINAIVKPLWGLLNKFLSDDLVVSTTNLENNIAMWDAISKDSNEISIQQQQQQKQQQKTSRQQKSSIQLQPEDLEKIK